MVIRKRLRKLERRVKRKCPKPGREALAARERVLQYLSALRDGRPAEPCPTPVQDTPELRSSRAHILKKLETLRMKMEAGE